MKTVKDRKMNRRLRRAVLLAAAVMAGTGNTPAAQAAPTPLLVAGGLTYDSVTGNG